MAAAVETMSRSNGPTSRDADAESRAFQAKLRGFADAEATSRSAGPILRDIEEMSRSDVALLRSTASAPLFRSARRAPCGQGLYQSRAFGGLPSIEAKIGLEIPELVARSDLEVDAAQGVVLHQQLPFPEHADDQVHRRVVQSDDLNGEVGDLGQLLLEVEDLPDSRERPGRILTIEDSHVDITVRSGGPPGHAPEKPGRSDPFILGPGREELSQRVCQRYRVQ